MPGKRTSTRALIATLVFGVSLFVGPISGTIARADDQATGKQVLVDVFGQGSLKVPAEFNKIQPKSRIVQHEFEATTDAGNDTETARITMMEAGGDVKANVRRWKSQFTGGDKEANKTEEISVGRWTVHIVDLNGSFGESMGGGPFAGGKVVQRENYAMTGAIVVPPDAEPESPKFFIKMIGPTGAVKANRARLIEMIKSLEK